MSCWANGVTRVLMRGKQEGGSDGKEEEAGSRITEEKRCYTLGFGDGDGSHGRECRQSSEIRVRTQTGY